MSNKFSCLWNNRKNYDNFNLYIYLFFTKIIPVSDPSLVREESYTLLAGSNLTLPCLEAQEEGGRGIHILHTLSWYCRYTPCTNCPRNCFRRCTWKNSFTLGQDLVFFKIPFSQVNLAPSLLQRLYHLNLQSFGYRSPLKEIPRSKTDHHPHPHLPPFYIHSGQQLLLHLYSTNQLYQSWSFLF